MMPSKRIKSLLITAVVCCFVSLQANAESDPQSVVDQYISALKSYQFEKAYKQVSKDMQQEMDQAQWSAVHKEMFTGAEVTILSYETSPAVYKEEKAIVPNWIVATDKILNKDGAKEFELYTLIKEGGEWRIDNQELLFGAEEIEPWFPKN